MPKAIPRSSESGRSSGPSSGVAPTRSRERARHLILLPTVDVVECDIHDPSVLARLVRGAGAAINLVGILFERGRQKFEAVQASGAEAVALEAYETALAAHQLSVLDIEQGVIRGRLVLGALLFIFIRTRSDLDDPIDPVQLGLSLVAPDLECLVACSLGDLVRRFRRRTAHNT